MDFDDRNLEDYNIHFLHYASLFPVKEKHNVEENGYNKYYSLNKSYTENSIGPPPK